MKTILLAAHATAGHTNGLRAIGRGLRERGHEVAFAIQRVRLPLQKLWPEPLRGASELSLAIEREGFRILPLRSAVSGILNAIRLPKARGIRELELALGLFTSGMEDQARAIARGIRELNADLVLGDYLLPAAHFGAKLAGRPYVALYHSALPFPVRNSAPFGSGLADDAPRDERWRNAEERLRRLSARYDAILTDAARALGLPKTSEAAIDRPVSDELNLLATLPEWEPGLEELHATVRMIGPCLPDAKANTSDSDDPALAAIRPGRQYVYVSLGTVFNDQSRIFDLILDGVLKTGFDAVVSAGASFERLRARESSRIHIFRKVPQIPLLKRVRLVVTHGGNNTVQETLSAGLPMIVIPFGGDQVANARRVERLGIGVALAADELSPERIADGLNRLSKTEVRKRARTLSMAAEGHDGVEAAAEAVLNLLSAGG